MSAARVYADVLAAKIDATGDATDRMQSVRHQCHLAHILEECNDAATARARFVKIAAIAFAAIESIDAKEVA